MTTPSKSYLSVAYDLRPAKQVERRMILDTLGRLMNQGLHVRDYQYTGFGSIYFFDFLLLYKLMGLRRFLTVEYDRDITKRVDFNKPFDKVNIRMDPVGDVIPDLSRDLQHILWLDFDDRIAHSMLEDAAAASYHLSSGSLLLMTVDAEPPAGTSKPEEREEYYREEAGDYLPFDFGRSWCGGTRLVSTNIKIIENAIASGLSARPDVTFLPLFKFVYADGHKMVTVGGIIGGDREQSIIDACDWSGATYVRRDPADDAYRIEVPKLTRKERLFLDRHMPCTDTWLPGEFELEQDMVLAYREVHRFYPHYGELLA